MTTTPANDFGVKWIPVAQELPPEGEIVLTKRHGRNDIWLKRRGRHWFSSDHQLRAEFTPTHWARD